MNLHELSRINEKEVVYADSNYVFECAKIVW
jgi:hypothetical protein